MKEIKNCWCGNANLHSFSPEYLLCKQCSTLVSQVGLATENLQVNNDEMDFYGKEYWFKHQVNDLAYPNIIQRSRSDLTERCLHWLRTLLKYKLPPAKSLELGCSHGGFVALLQQAGFDATGLEMSPWVVEFARKSFDVPMMLGPLEKQDIPLNSFDMIHLFDVMEHLPNPKATLQQCFSLLKPDGLLMIQMPNYQPEKTYAAMVAKNDPFLTQLKSDEHLYLFSKSSVDKFFHQLGFDQIYITFEPAIFAQYDMFFIVSKKPLIPHTQEMIDSYLKSTTHTRHVQAMLDLANERDTYIKLYQEKTKDFDILHRKLLRSHVKKILRFLFSYPKKLLLNR